MEKNSQQEFTCINCGTAVKELYKKYSATVLKLVTCHSCGYVADKYIEYDPVIVILDLILLRKEAYRHILYNTKFASHWKLTIILQMMESYSELMLITPKYSFSDAKTNYYIVSSDVQFYKLITRIVFRTLCFMLMIMLMTTIYISMLKKKKKVSISLKIVWKAIILSNFGLLLLLPSLIWNNAMQEFHFTFVILYTTLSQLLAYTVVCNCSKVWSIVVIVLSYYCKIFSNDLYNMLYDQLFISS